MGNVINKDEIVNSRAYHILINNTLDVIKQIKNNDLFFEKVYPKFVIWADIENQYLLEPPKSPRKVFIY